MSVSGSAVALTAMAGAVGAAPPLGMLRDLITSTLRNLDAFRRCVEEAVRAGHDVQALDMQLIHVRALLVGAARRGDDAALQQPLRNELQSVTVRRLRCHKRFCAIDISTCPRAADLRLSVDTIMASAALMVGRLDDEKRQEVAHDVALVEDVAEQAFAAEREWHILQLALQEGAAAPTARMVV